MLCSEIFESRSLFEGQAVEAAGTTVIINPVPSDIARLLVKDSSLRALSEPGRFVVWIAEEALHQPVQIALKMDTRARRYFLFSSTQPNPRAVAKIGRFYAWLMDSANALIKPEFMGAQVKLAFGIRAR